jgi:ATP-dependent Clp endopeptidase proteolytic subunit ClpP
VSQNSKKQQKNKFFKMKMSANDSSSADIFIYGEIVPDGWQWAETDMAAIDFKNELDALGDGIKTINLYINSPGGSVFEGIAIHNMLKRHQAKVNVHIDALAASIASVIAMAGDTIFMPKNSMLMIHNPETLAMGNSAELRKVADDLDRIGQSSKQAYLQKAGDKLTDEKLQELLDAETWLSADEAYQYGLCDVVEEAVQAAASISTDLFQRYKKVPKNLLENQQQGPSAEEMVLRQRIADEAKANQAYLETILGGLI